MEASLDVVILVSGRGTQLRSHRPVALHRILGLPLLEYVLRSARGIPPRAVFVAAEGGEELAGELPGAEFRGAHADAIREAVAAPRFLVLPGDMPLVPPDALRKLYEEHISHGAIVSLLAFVPDDPPRRADCGRVVRDEAGVPRAVTGREGDGSAELCSGVFCVENVPEVWEALGASAGGPLGIRHFAALVSAFYPRTHAATWPAADDLLRASTRADLALAEAVLRGRTVARLQEAGVTVVDPATAYVGPDVAVGPDTVIHPAVYIYGETEIGEGCEIGPQAYLIDSSLGDGVRVWFSVLEGAVVDDGARIGPYAHLRPGARIGKGARIGNFVEVKNSRVGDGVRAGHLSYIGDAEVGPDANIGAGTITCNYDGVRKHRTVIGEGAFIGSNTSLVAPVVIGEGAVVGAGSVITEDVPPHALALERSRQVIKPGWALKRRRGED